MTKQYHFGVVGVFDEDTSTWTFDATYINGDDSPFPAMDWGEVYDPDEGDVADPGWQHARWRSDDPTESANFDLLTEAIKHANHRLKALLTTLNINLDEVDAALADIVPIKED